MKIKYSIYSCFFYRYAYITQKYELNKIIGWMKEIKIQLINSFFYINEKITYKVNDYLMINNNVQSLKLSNKKYWISLQNKLTYIS